MPAAAQGALPRALTDRPDDFAGPQVHVLYVVAADVADRELDTGGEVGASVESWQRWLRGQTGGRGIRLDTYQGRLDVTFFRLAATSAAAALLPIATIGAALSAAGFSSPDKIYAVYYDGASTASCGNGGGAYPSVYLTGSDSRSSSSCIGPSGTSPPSYLDFSLLHELVHSLGYVPACAPHATSTQHADDSPLDLMWGNGPWASLEGMQLDVGHDDYFDAFLPGCPDLAGSRYLEGGGATLALRVKHVGAAAGTVEASVAGRPPFTCAQSSCPAYFDTWPVRTVTLTARLETTTDQFEGWSGACQGTSETCTVAIDASKEVGATFAPKAAVPLRVELRGSGTVTSDPAGIACPGRCSAEFAYETPVALHPAAARGWRFDGWSRSDSCSRLDVVCDLVLIEPASPRATFVRVQIPVRVSVGGAGRVVSTPAGLSCPRLCSAAFAFGTVLALRPVPAHGWRFAGWSGSCGGKGDCRLTLTGGTTERRAHARFARRR